MAMTSPYGAIENIGLGTMRGDGRPSKKAAARELMAPITGRWKRLVSEAEDNMRLRKAQLRWEREQAAKAASVDASDFRHSSSMNATVPASPKVKIIRLREAEPDLPQRGKGNVQSFGCPQRGR